MDLSHATEEGDPGAASESTAQDKSLVNNLKSMLSKPKQAKAA